MKRFVPFLLLILVVGCGESLDPASLVLNLRGVAALWEVDGEPERPNPRPGETVTATIRVIDRGPRPPIQWRFVACVPEFTLFNTPVCRGIIEPCDNCEGADTTGADPMMRFQVPDDATVEEVDEVLLQGTICNGTPAPIESFLAFILGEVDEINPCEDPSDEGTLVVARIQLDNFEPDNLQPEIVEVLRDGGAWDDVPPPDAPIVGCGEGRSITSTTPLIRLSVTPESLQLISLDDVEIQEEIQVSWLADDGEFERSFSFVDVDSPLDEDGNPFVEVNWAFPDTADPSGTLVRFNFVIRDGFGGTDWLERGFCVVP